MNKIIITVLVLFLQYDSYAQTQSPQIENLVFEGAGIRGIAYSGAIIALEQNNILPGVKRVGGTSAGAITALMLSLGYTANEIIDIIGNTNFKKFNDGHLFFIGGLVRFNKLFGWYRGNRVERWLEAIIQAKTGNANSTFADLKQKGFKDLYITGTSLTRQQLMVFSFEKYPLMQVKDAVRISMNIPFYFEAVFMDSAGNIIKKPADKTGLDVMVDGGFTGNFPIRLFDSTKYISSKTLNAFAYNAATLGFRIDRDEQIINDEKGTGLAAIPIANLKEYTSAFYVMLIENLNRQTLAKEDWTRTVSISDAAISPRIRKLSKDEISKLVTNGNTAVVQYLSRQ